MPIFKSTPARSTLPPVGASTWAKGSQVWTGKAHEERDEHPELQVAPFRGHWERVAGETSSERGDVEGEQTGMGGVPEHNREQSQEGQHAPGEGVKKELDGSPPTIVMTPDADQEKEWHEGKLEEHIKEDDVACGKDPEHGGLQQQQQAVEADGFFLNGIPADKHRGDSQQGREAKEPDR
jgi:hypothetical protein